MVLAMPALRAFEILGQLTHFGLRALAALPSALRRPRDLLCQLHNVLVGSLPLGTVAGLAVGAVVWIHLRGTVRDLAGEGAVQLLPQALALAVALEFAPLSAGLIVAGRTGASLGAELGAMRLTEQIDALEALGESPLRILVAPRVLACALALPPLTVIIAYLAILSGFLAETIGGGTLNWSTFQDQCRSALALHPGQVIASVLRTVVFGYLVGVMGCRAGMGATGGTEGVGRAATTAVVGSIFLVLVSNVLLVQAIQLLWG
jgi:phospholipid/cholesterol/gamma-HCH transport system permease protein